jgi:hypothetical protein
MGEITAYSIHEIPFKFEERANGRLVTHYEITTLLIPSESKGTAAITFPWRLKGSTNWTVTKVRVPEIESVRTLTVMVDPAKLLDARTLRAVHVIDKYVGVESANVLIRAATRSQDPEAGVTVLLDRIEPPKPAFALPDMRPRKATAKRQADGSLTVEYEEN